MTKEQILQDIDLVEEILLNDSVKEKKALLLNKGMIVDIEKPYITITHDLFFAVYNPVNKQIRFKPTPTSEAMIGILTTIEWTKEQLVDYINHIDQDIINALSLS